jgi:hypothetical protein
MQAATTVSTGLTCPTGQGQGTSSGYDTEVLYRTATYRKLYMPQHAPCPPMLRLSCGLPLAASSLGRSFRLPCGL